MKRLEKEFTSKGVSYKEVERVTIGDQDYRLYERDGRAGELTLARIDVKKATVMFSKDVPEREAFPASAEWGTKAWDFSGPYCLAMLAEKPDTLRKRVTNEHI